MDPLSTTYRQKSFIGFDAEDDRIRLRGFFHDSPHPSTWPRTMCPPKKSLSRRAFSRLTRSPALRFRRFVLSRVSAETSAVKTVCLGNHCQACAVDGDAVADLDVMKIEGRLDLQQGIFPLAGQASDGSHRCNDSCEHFVSLHNRRQSPPIWLSSSSFFVPEGP